MLRLAVALPVTAIMLAEGPVLATSDRPACCLVGHSCHREHDGDVVEITSGVIALALKNRTKDDLTVLAVRVWSSEDWVLRSPSANLDDGEAASFVS